MTQEKPARVYLLDELRGWWVIMMVAYHGMYDLAYIFGVNFPAFRSAGMQLFQQIICCGFIFLSGISSRYTRNGVKRGLFTLACGMVISLGTYIFMPSQMIYFGILHFLGAAMILTALLRPLLDKLPPALGLPLCLVVWQLLYELPNGRIGVRGMASIDLPLSWYAHPGLMPLGFGGAGSDYFPLLPWIFLFFAGAYFGIWVRAGKMPAACYKPHVPWLSAVGKRAIVIYLLHQPVLYGVLWLFFGIARGTI